MLSLGKPSGEGRQELPGGSLREWPRTSPFPVPTPHPFGLAGTRMGGRRFCEAGRSRTRAGGSAGSLGPAARPRAQRWHLPGDAGPGPGPGQPSSPARMGPLPGPLPRVGEEDSATAGGGGESPGPTATTGRQCQQRRGPAGPPQSFTQPQLSAAPQQPRATGSPVPLLPGPLWGGL